MISIHRESWVSPSGSFPQRLPIVRQRPGVETFRFWQEGPGYDRNLDRVDTVLAAIDYIHRNPERRGLVDRAIGEGPGEVVEARVGMKVYLTIRTFDFRNLKGYQPSFWRKQQGDGRKKHCWASS